MYYGGIKMISNQILQNTLEGMKAITTVDLCVMDTDGKILASTCAKAEECSGAARTFAKSTIDSKQEKDYLFLKLFYS
jgi:carbohydrate diacid regulator